MKTFYLKHPVSLGERTITELTLQDPHVRHLMRTDAYGVNTIAADVALCSALSGESEALLANLHIEDWALIRVELQKIYTVFFGVKAEMENNADEQNPTKAAD
nr:MAG TPA: tail assembly chaperone protein [Caudoviricetes sp.]